MFICVCLNVFGIWTELNGVLVGNTGSYFVRNTKEELRMYLSTVQPNKLTLLIKKLVKNISEKMLNKWSDYILHTDRVVFHTTAVCRLLPCWGYWGIQPVATSSQSNSGCSFLFCYSFGKSAAEEITAVLSGRCIFDKQLFIVFTVAATQAFYVNCRQ